VHDDSSERPTRPRLDLRTLSLAVAILGGYVLWTLSFTVLPLWLAAPLGAVILAWYGSLQHETIHGHPTRSKRVNALIGGVPLSLWVPYAIYRETHIQHHRHSGRRLTEVDHDPESFYLAPGHLANVGWMTRLALRANCTLAGRVLVGPAIAIATFAASEIRKARVDRRYRWIWLRHAMAVAFVLAWTVGVCQIPLWVYVLLVVYPSISLTHLRSFAEHRADDHSHLRTNVVEAGPVWSLLFLNNNLHVAHHMHPHVPWHRLPELWRRMQSTSFSAGVVFRGGYRQVIREYLFRPFITAEHPFGRPDPQ
jgi:fatty acid desaturase